MLGMHGTVVANYAVDHADLLLAFGVRFDDRVTGKLEAFATRARIVHIDIDPAEINKNKEAHISMCSDMRPTLKLLNAAVAKSPVDRSCYDGWRADIMEQQEKHPQRFPTRDDVIIPQEAVKVWSKLTLITWKWKSAPSPVSVISMLHIMQNVRMPPQQENRRSEICLP